jgi:hypothetical protein
MARARMEDEDRKVEWETRPPAREPTVTATLRVAVVAAVIRVGDTGQA